MRAKLPTLKRGLVAMPRRLRKPPTLADGELEAHDWPRVLDWAERQGTESMKARFATADLLAKEAQATLTVLLAGIGGSAAYAAKMFDPGPAAPASWGFAAACAYLVVLSVVLIMRCMRFESYPAQFQTPKNLMQRGFAFDALREVELENLTIRIEDATGINNRRASVLNKIRIAAALSPAVFLFAAVVAIPAGGRQSTPLTIACTQLSPVVPASGVGFDCKLSQ